MSATSVISSTFPETTKLEIKRIYGDKCFLCSSYPINICHVIAREDSQINIWEERGLLNFSLVTPDNAIPLCPTCHSQFDMAMDPGVIFIPSDIKYFIDFELKQRREQSESAFERRVPTAEMYRQHQLEQGIGQPEDRGGLYRPIFLKKYMPNLDIDAISYDRAWHGSPIATLRRAFMALGSGRLGKLPKQTRLDLTNLRDLYFLDDGDDDDDSRRKGNVQTFHKGPKRHLDEDSHEGEERPKKQRGTTSETAKTRSSQDRESSREKHLKSDGQVQEEWVLGPQFTAKDIISRYGPVVSQ